MRRINYVSQDEWNKIDMMFEAGCHGREAASVLGISARALADMVLEAHGISLGDYRAIKMARGDGLLRVAQMKLALSGDRQMLIWLGKQRLQQSETPKTLQGFDGKLKLLLSYMDKMTPEETASDSDRAEVDEV